MESTNWTDLVSIIIPAYNAEKTIKACIESVLNQTWNKIELIIIDDGSNDNTSSIIKLFLNDKRIIYKYQNNQGCSSAKNTGLRIAKGAYVQYLDADDILSSDKLETQINILKSNPDSIAICKTIKFENQPLNLDKNEIDTDFLYTTNNPLEFLLNLYGKNGKNGMIQPNAFLVPKTIIEKAGPWDQNISPSPDEDGEYFSRIILSCSQIIYTPGPINYYRVNIKNSLSKQHSYHHALGALKSIIKIKENLLMHDSSMVTKSVIANKIVSFQYIYFNLYPDLIKVSDKVLHSLGSLENKPMAGGAKFKTFAALIGMRNALIIKKHMSKLNLFIGRHDNNL